MQADNLVLLAEILECSPDELAITSAADVFTNHNQLNRTADMIENEGLVHDIFAEGKWSLIENILKSVIHLHMPRNAMARMYIYLSLLAWVQYKLEESEAYASKAVEIGKKIQSTELIARGNVLLSLKKIFSSELVVSQQLLEEAVRMSLDPESLSLGYINLGINRWFFGDYKAAEQHTLASFAFIAQLKDSTSKFMLDNTAHAVLANVSFDAGQFNPSEQSCLTSLQIAETSGYKRGIGLAQIRLAELKALQGHTKEGIDLFEKGMQLISPSEILLLIYESGSAVYRLHGDLVQAEQWARRGIKESRFYTGEGTFRLQLAKIEAKRGDRAKALEHLAEARIALKRSGCLMRLEALKNMDVFFDDRGQ
jgi:tetratricopeptide (TPR) repeat protein